MALQPLHRVLHGLGLAQLQGLLSKTILICLLGPPNFTPVSFAPRSLAPKPRDHFRGLPRAHGGEVEARELAGLLADRWPRLTQAAPPAATEGGAADGSGLRSHDWRNLGFQNRSPETDFRAMGALDVKVIPTPPGVFH